MVEHPTFCRIEYWSPIAAEWWVGHGGINLINPQKYIQKVTNTGRVARAVVVDTGEVIYPDGGDLL